MKGQVAFAGVVIVHASEVIEVHGYTEAGRLMRIYVDGPEKEKLRKTFAFAENYGVHLGHAFWHVTNLRDHERCGSCHL